MDRPHSTNPVSTCRWRLAAFTSLLACLAATAVQADGSDQMPAEPRLRAPLPMAVDDTAWRPLRGDLDTRLQAALETRIEAVPEWRELARRRCLAVGVVDLSDVARPRFARVNGDHMMYAASLVKIGLLLAAMEGLEEGRLTDDAGLRSDLRDMIRVSSNPAATRVFDRLGPDYIARVLRDPRWQLYDEQRGGLWVGKPFARRGPRLADPRFGIIHGATATQICRFYYLLATGRLINRERSRQMLAVLTDPGIDHKLVRAIERRSPRAQLFRKSGTWHVWHADSILVWGPIWRRYILVVLVQDPGGERIVEDILPAAEQVLRGGEP